MGLEPAAEDTSWSLKATALSETTRPPLYILRSLHHMWWKLFSTNRIYTSGQAFRWSLETGGHFPRGFESHRVSLQNLSLLSVQQIVGNMVLWGRTVRWSHNVPNWCYFYCFLRNCWKLCLLGDEVLEMKKELPLRREHGKGGEETWKRTELPLCRQKIDAPCRQQQFDAH